MWKASCLYYVLLAGCSSAAFHDGQRTTQTFVEHIESDVLVVALAADDVPKEFLEVQLKIVANAAHNGPVLVVATSGEQQAQLNDLCSTYEGLCVRLREGSVRVVVEPHRGPWVRDYGPFVNFGHGESLVIVDAKYDDARRRQGLEYQREQINALRRALIEKELGDDGGDDDLSTHENAIAKQLSELAQIYKDEGDLRERAMDDDAPFYIAEAALGNDQFELTRSSLFLDGGNLFRLENGDCLTTTDTIAKNDGNRNSVEHELESIYHCRKTIFLEALPGEDIIKHLDMFLMPVKDTTVLLASYDPGSVAFQEQYAEMDTELRALAVDSAIAMAHNKAHLQQQGYNVVDVPALLPRRSDDSVFFPTLLNGVVQVGRDGRRHLLLPDYETSSAADGAIRKAARAAIQHTFGSDVDIVTIEATAPARLQGALHCLTNAIPLTRSVFARPDDIARMVRERVSAYKVKSARSAHACLDPMLGEWVERESGTRALRSRTHNELMVMSVENAALRLRSDDDEISLSYTASCRSRRPNEALLKVEARGGSFALTLRHERDDTLVMSSEAGLHGVFVRPSAARSDPDDPSDNEEVAAPPEK